MDHRAEPDAPRGRAASLDPVRGFRKARRDHESRLANRQPRSGMGWPVKLALLCITGGLVYVGARRYLAERPDLGAILEPAPTTAAGASAGAPTAVSPPTRNDPPLKEK